jgi:hypothetical protein
MPDRLFTTAPTTSRGRRVKQTASPQQVIERLAERCLKASQSSPHCRLGSEPRPRRGGGCSACTARQEFEIDRVIAQLIDSGSFARAGVCPYQVIASHLVAGLTLGPEVSRTRSTRRPRVDPVVEVKGLLRRIRSLLFATGPSPDNIEAIAISNAGAWWQALSAVLAAERSLERALALFESRIPVNTIRSPRGRTGALHNQAVARAMAGAWRQLTGRLPAKDNSKIHGLLLAAIVSIVGHADKEPNLESLTKTAVERIKKDAASRS